MIVSPYQYVAFSFTELILFIGILEILVALALIWVVLKRKKRK